MLGFTGPGHWSVDQSLGILPLSDGRMLLVGLIIVVVALFAALPPVLRSRRFLATGSPAVNTNAST